MFIDMYTTLLLTAFFLHKLTVYPVSFETVLLLDILHE